MVLLSLSLLLNCTQVPIKDSVFTGSLGVDGGAVFHTLTTDSEVITLQQFAKRWNDLSDPLVCTTSSTFADWKADIEKLCSFSNYCTTDMQTAVDTFYSKITAADNAAKSALKKARSLKHGNSTGP